MTLIGNSFLKVWELADKECLREAESTVSCEGLKNGDQYLVGAPQPLECWPGLARHSV